MYIYIYIYTYGMHVSEPLQRAVGRSRPPQHRREKNDFLGEIFIRKLLLE